MTMAEARERNDEIVAFLDAALTNRIVSYRGKYFSFSNVRLLPRPLQQPFPRAGRPSLAQTRRGAPLGAG